MTRRAIVVGLGSATESLLNAIDAQFAQAGQGEQVSCLWLPPYASGEIELGQPLRVMPLTLTPEQINTLYFRSTVRTWSGPNWRTWGKAIASNRLLGKLSAFQYLDQIYETLHELASLPGLSHTYDLNYYLVAPLHDPFASGALVDIAYLLHKLALDRRARVFGMLLLPGMTGDPAAVTNSTADKQLREATAYATLRELQFYCGSTSFFGNHHLDLPLEFSDESPFKSGDAYLMGGEQNEAAVALTYEQVRADVAQWVYLQTATPMGDYVPTSDKSRALFSSFGIGRYTHLEIAADDHALQVIALQTLEGVLAPPKSDGASALLLAQSLSTRFVDAIERDLDQELRANQGLAVEALPKVGLNDAYLARVHQFEDEQSAHIDELEARLATRLEREIEQSTRETPRILDEVIAQQGLSLPQINQHFSQAYRHLQDTVRRSQSEIEQLQDNAEATARNLQELRASYVYLTAPSSFFWVLRLCLLSVGSMALVLLTIAGESLPLLALAGLLLAAYRLSMVYQQRTLSETRQEFGIQQRAFAQLQRSLVRHRTVHTYRQALEQQLKQHLRTSDGASRLDIQIARLESLREEKTLPSDATIDSAPLVEALLPKLWKQNSDTPLTWDFFQSLVQQTAQTLQTQTAHADEQTRLKTQVEGARARAQIMLSANVNLIPSDDRQRLHATIVVGSYSPPTMQWLHEQTTDARHRLVSHTSDPSTGEVVVALVRANIPLVSLINLSLWRSHYWAACRPRADEPYRARALLHPTRVGIATPDLMASPPAVLDFPPLVMLMTFLLRLQPGRQALEALLQRLPISPSSPLNFDELCGALQEDSNVLAEHLARAEATSLSQPPEEILEEALALSDAAPKTSETFADWEIWAYQLLDQVIHQPRHRSTRRLLAQFYSLFRK